MFEEGKFPFKEIKWNINLIAKVIDRSWKKKIESTREEKIEFNIILIIVFILRYNN